MQILDATVRAAVAAATDQEAQLTALIAGVTTVKTYGGSTLRDTGTYAGGMTINTAVTPRTAKLGALTGRSIADGSVTATRHVYCAGATEVFELSAAEVALSTNLATAHTSLGDPVDGAVTVTAQSGLPVSATPTWLAGSVLNEWFAISGTVPAIASAFDGFCGWCFKENTLDLYGLAVGGHNNGSDNRVIRMRLSDAAPAWSTVNAASPSVTLRAPYNPDGKPASRHTYHNAGFWLPTLNRIMLIGAKFVADGGAPSHNTVDGYNPTNDTWDAGSTYVGSGDVGDPANWNNDGTWANITSAGFIGVAKSPSDTVLCFAGRRKWVNNVMSGSGASVEGTDVYNCWAWDTDLNRFFGLSYGTGQGATTTTRARACSEALSLTDLTVSGSGLAQFEADTCEYPGMDYDQVNGYFLFYAGNTAGAAGRVYKITMSGTTACTIEIFSHGAGNVPLPQNNASVNGGANNKFTYIPEYNGFLSMPVASGGCYSMRTS